MALLVLVPIVSAEWPLAVLAVPALVAGVALLSWDAHRRDSGMRWGQHAWKAGSAYTLLVILMIVGAYVTLVVWGWPAVAWVSALGVSLVVIATITMSRFVEFVDSEASTISDSRPQ